MPWWSWILIWLFLVFALLGMLAIFAVVLFRKMMTAADAVGELGDQVAALDATADELDPDRVRPAIFADAAELADGVRRRRSENAHSRQVRIDRRVESGKLLRYVPDETED